MQEVMRLGDSSHEGFILELIMRGPSLLVRADRILNALVTVFKIIQRGRGRLTFDRMDTGT